MNKDRYLIGDVANLMGMSRDTLRHYEKRGLVTAKKAENGYRYYTEADISRLIGILYQRKMDIGEIQTAPNALTAAAPHGTCTRFPFHRPQTADTNSVGYLNACVKNCQEIFLTLQLL